MSKQFFRKGFSLAIVAILIVGVLAGCGKKTEDATDSTTSIAPSTEATTSAAPTETEAANAGGEEITGTITASGSTALQPLVQRAAEYFMKDHDKLTINVTGGGSGTGVKNVHDGVSDIGNSDVEAAAELKDGLVDHIVTIAPFALIVNQGVGVEDLTLAQATDIFTGVTTNWSQVGGKDLKIVLVHRQESSGSRKLVKKIVLGDKDFTKEGLTQDSSKLVATTVGTTDGAIGYVDVPYLAPTYKVNALKIGGVAYSSDTIKDGTYPLFGLEHMYTKGEATGATKAFLEYMISKEFTEKEDVLALGFLSPDLLKK
ncbi:phosphate ABC transporter substrate-binding protein [Paenibacillus psychroresistens]|uniref:Phosphate-binding protein n=1 Tax=Paenibacillus psychroresistens TaxID=1778678 RepID=A0A6B8RPX9_9BACL|nr:phosphate ABC transporter substrate-binding protein [Paenibacillus psychroresistens]QGQ97585.1 phosphate ABC transporter substrate-binding protein [Paenibacillus psychroresistens]